MSKLAETNLNPFSRGGFAGITQGVSGGDTIDLSTNYYDVTRTTVANCTTESSKTCIGINSDGLSPDYFTDNNAIFPNWDQTNVWTFDGSLPGA